MANTADWFSVDKEGLAKLLERKGKASAVLELIQNAWDEKGVTQVTITLTEAGVRGRSHLVVEDDAPDGFHDMTHINTLFAPSAKVTDATKRGALGKTWFDQPDQHQVDALLIHEFAHHKVREHLSEKYHDECCRLGALLRDSSVRLEK
jgi:hypothetical protein